MTQAPLPQDDGEGMDSMLEKVMAEVRSKHFTASLTQWVNFLAAVLLLCEANLHMLQPLLPVNVFTVAAFVLPIVNMALRFKTKQGITL